MHVIPLSLNLSGVPIFEEVTCENVLGVNLAPFCVLESYHSPLVFTNLRLA